MSTQEGWLGIRERFIAVEEVAYGTAPSFATATVPGNNIVVTPTFTQGFQEVLNNGADSRTINKQVAGPLGLIYDLEYYPTNWSRLKYMFDIDSETGSDPYTHTLSVGNTQKSFSAEWVNRHTSDSNIYQLYGNVVQMMTISFQKATGAGNDGFVRVRETVVAQDYDPDQSLTAGSFTVSGDPFQYRHLDVTLEGSSVIPINSGQIIFEQGINPNDSRYASTSLDRNIGTPISTVFRIRGTFNLNLFETTFNTMWEAATALSGTNTIVFEQSASNKLTLTLSGVYVEPIPMSGTNLEGVNTGDFVFVATGVVPVAIDSISEW